MIKRKLVEVSGRIMRETEKAVLVDINDEEVWLPLSQVEEITRRPEGDTLLITAWIAEQKGL